VQGVCHEDESGKKKVADAFKIETIVCWKICGPQTRSLKV